MTYWRLQLEQKISNVNSNIFSFALVSSTCSLRISTVIISVPTFSTIFCQHRKKLNAAVDACQFGIDAQRPFQDYAELPKLWPSGYGRKGDHIIHGCYLDVRFVQPADYCLKKSTLMMPCEKNAMNCLASATCYN